jgi:hypothetical protein
VKLLVYDATCRERTVGLSDLWFAGSALYRALGRFDRCLGARSWQEALDWLAESDAPIDEIQYWGHGKWGRVLCGGEALSLASLDEQHAHRPRLDALRARLAPDALLWFRTCETFGARVGHRFAQALTAHLGCRVAGHTFVIAFWQSGLHLLAPGARPHWSVAEGLAQGTPEAPLAAQGSRPWSPNTVSCLTGSVPAGY